MIFGFFLMVILFGLGAAFSRPSLFLTISFHEYEFYFSVFTGLGLIVGVFWLWALLLRPFKWMRRFSIWREKSKKDQVQAFWIRVLEALVNQTKEQ